MASAFSSKAEDVFTKNIEIGYENEVKDELLEEYYEIDTCVKFITQNSYEKVGTFSNWAELKMAIKMGA